MSPNRKPTIKMPALDISLLRKASQAPFMSEEDVRRVGEDPELLERDTIPAMPAVQPDDYFLDIDIEIDDVGEEVVFQPIGRGVRIDSSSCLKETSVPSID